MNPKPYILISIFFSIIPIICSLGIPNHYNTVQIIQELQELSNYRNPQMKGPRSQRSLFLPPWPRAPVQGKERFRAKPLVAEASRVGRACSERHSSAVLYLGHNLRDVSIGALLHKVCVIRLQHVSIDNSSNSTCCQKSFQ